MSLKQRRDHRPRIVNSGTDRQLCLDCGGECHQVYHRESGKHYWRHLRRWYREPLR